MHSASRAVSADWGQPLPDFTFVPRVKTPDYYGTYVGYLRMEAAGSLADAGRVCQLFGSGCKTLVGSSSRSERGGSGNRGPAGDRGQVWAE